MSQNLPSWNRIFPHWGHAIRLPPSLAPWVAQMPLDQGDLDYALELEAAQKIELHVHMEAAVPADFYKDLNEQLKLHSVDKMPAQRAPFASLRDFIGAWIDNTRLVTDEQVFTQMALAAALARKSQNIVYSEMHISPVDFSLMRRRTPGRGRPLDLEAALISYLSGTKMAETQVPGVAIRVVFDGLWITDESERSLMLDILSRTIASEFNRDSWGEPILVGIGLGGEEVDRSKEALPFVDACRSLGLKVDIHSGETGPADRHQRALSTLTPERVGHGFAGADIDWFYEGHVAACPLSNCLTGSFQGPLSKHPIRRMLDKGVNFSINTDDPLLFSTTLTLEYVALRKALGLGIDFFKHTQQKAFEAVFAPKTLARVWR